MSHGLPQEHLAALDNMLTDGFEALVRDLCATRNPSLYDSGLGGPRASWVMRHLAAKGRFFILWSEEPAYQGRNIGAFLKPDGSIEGAPPAELVGDPIEDRAELAASIGEDAPFEEDEARNDLFAAHFFNHFNFANLECLTAFGLAQGYYNGYEHDLDAINDYFVAHHPDVAPSHEERGALLDRFEALVRRTCAAPVRYLYDSHVGGATVATEDLLSAMGALAAVGRVHVVWLAYDADATHRALRNASRCIAYFKKDTRFPSDVIGPLAQLLAPEPPPTPAHSIPPLMPTNHATTDARTHDSNDDRPEEPMNDRDPDQHAPHAASDAPGREHLLDLVEKFTRPACETPFPDLYDTSLGGTPLLAVQALERAGRFRTLWSEPDPDRGLRHIGYFLADQVDEDELVPMARMLSSLTPYAGEDDDEDVPSFAELAHGIRTYFERKTGHDLSADDGDDAHGEGDEGLLANGLNSHPSNGTRHDEVAREAMAHAHAMLRLDPDYGSAPDPDATS